MTRRLVFVSFLIALLVVTMDAGLLAQRAADVVRRPAPARNKVDPPVPLFVTSLSAEADAAKGFTSRPTKEVEALAKYAKGGVFVLVDDRVQAAVILAFATQEKRAVAGSHLLSWSATKNEVVVTGVLITGDYRKDLTARDGGLEGALNKLAFQAETFVVDNQAKIAVK